jgi:serine/threonine protein kinase
MLQAEVKQYGRRTSGSKHGDDYITDLQLLRLLGRGGFANVYEARWQGCQTAVKVIDAALDPRRYLVYYLGYLREA